MRINAAAYAGLTDLTLQGDTTPISCLGPFHTDQKRGHRRHPLGWHRAPQIRDLPLVEGHPEVATACATGKTWIRRIIGHVREDAPIFLVQDMLETCAAHPICITRWGSPAGMPIRSTIRRIRPRGRTLPP